jgi:small-conductance mechanosensitive channel
MRRRRIVAGLGTLVALLLSASTARRAAADQTSVQPTPVAAPQGAPVELAGKPLFVLYARIGSFGPEDRARALIARLEQLVREDGSSLQAIALKEDAGATDIVAGERLLITVTDADAAAAGTTREILASQWLAATRTAVAAVRHERSTTSTLLALLYTALATAALLVLLALVRRSFRTVRTVVARWRGTRIKPLRIQRLEVVSADQMTAALLLAVRVVHLAVWLLLLLIYAPLVFSFFPVTRRLVESAADSVLTALRTVGAAVLASVPSLAFLLVVGAVAWVAIRFLRVVFGAIETGSIVIPGFYPDWARPTYKIARFVVIIIALIAMFPYIPGSGSVAFRGISLLIGAILSLGSTSAVSNIVAGVVLTYTRAFQVGDRVQIADTVGDVVARTLLVTRVRTIKNVDVTIPNSQVLASHVSNFTSRAREGGLILHTTVTIGYDAAWRTVHELLLRAARATPGVLAEPAPFVLQTSLDDFYVSYQINATTDAPERMAETYSALHQNIQDTFNEAGVEIMSPAYRAVRDGNRVTIPGDTRSGDDRTGAPGVESPSPRHTPPAGEER